MTVTAEQIALVIQLIPSAAVADEVDGGYGWNETYIETLMDARGFTSTEAVRFFWFQRVTETAEYLDIGKPLSQIHRQAREMLDYWDGILAKSTEALSPAARSPLSFGEIEGPWDA